MSKQSSVEWLHHEFERIDKEFHVGSHEYNYAKNLAFKISKAMHKEEIINFHIGVMKIGLIEEGERIWTDAYLPKIKEMATQYYNETFGSSNTPISVE